MKTSLAFLTISMVLLSCHSSKETCKKFYTYSSRSINAKGLSVSLKKAGVELGSITAGEISIDRKNVLASEKLQQLDLFQYTICGQMKSLNNNDSIKQHLRVEWIETLKSMASISQKPDSLSGGH